ncbi:aspartate aminotransferase family protein [Denitromonas iodatirespirans]|uniref:Aspartate aminotransferase family protein n=1 Tax=Denitromonas iodatirespirans TaxID=2795389 RepID=A0A944HBF9_DENI1|nr:aspartate aminotransferase family protein [Denitromonas iodatirespirans]MBT0961627.1 aspartate aminotransferase family protein [Denitromonas iodatirespirans]
MNTVRTTAALRALDAAHHLHPFTNARELNAQGVRIIESARGVYLTDSDGQKILDGMSGLWCSTLGYGRREILDAVTKQMEVLPFYNTFFKTSHPPVIQLSKRLAEVTPSQFNHFMFTGSGSESNDTIFRLVRYYWDLVGQPDKTVFISRHNSYHGSTVAAASLGGLSAMHKQGGLPIPGIVHAPQPAWWAEGGDMSPDSFGLHVARQTLDMIDEIGADKVAAMFAEPIQGAGGVIIPPATYWPELSKGLKERDILLISDEVICGFGRTGHWFGCELMNTQPDFMTLAKGITSGYIPLGAVAVSDRIASALLAHGDEFAHGFTYSGHPAACAAALATLDIMQSEDVVRRVHDDIGPYLQEKWRSLAEHPMIGEATMEGLIGSFQFCADKQARTTFPASANIGLAARDFSFDNGLVMRAVGDRMVIAPPFVLSRGEVDELISKASQTIDQTYQHARKLGLIA